MFLFIINIYSYPVCTYSYFIPSTRLACTYKNYMNRKCITVQSRDNDPTKQELWTYIIFQHCTKCIDPEYTYMPKSI